MVKQILVGLGLVAVSVFGLSKGLAAADGKISDASQTIASDDAVPSIFEELRGIRLLSCQNQCTRQALEMTECDPEENVAVRLACKTIRNAQLAYFGDYETCMNRCMDESESTYGGPGSRLSPDPHKD